MEDIKFDTYCNTITLKLDKREKNMLVSSAVVDWLNRRVRALCKTNPRLASDHQFRAEFTYFLYVQMKEDMDKIVLDYMKKFITEFYDKDDWDREKFFELGDYEDAIDAIFSVGDRR